MEQQPLTEFERARQELIARNRARLVALGIPQALAGLHKLLPQKPQPKPKAPKPQAPKQPPAQPTRQSARLRQPKDASGSKGSTRLLPEGVEQGSELAVFIIDGECPRCGKVLSRGHAAHLERCTGPVELTEEELAAQAARYGEVQAARLRELELGGLVDYTPPTPADPDTGAEAAAACGTFIVIGATGNHYVVKLTEPKRTCTCLDHRFRRHDCKHIKLLLQQLEVADNPSGWQQAVEAQVANFQLADASDMAMVQEANARAAARAAKAAAKKQAAAAAAAAEAEEPQPVAGKPKQGSKKGAKQQQQADDRQRRRDQGAPEGRNGTAAAAQAPAEAAAAGRKRKPAQAGGADTADAGGAAVQVQSSRSRRRTAAETAAAFM